MKALQDKIRKTAKDLLTSGEIFFFIGWEQTPGSEQTRPAFIFRAEETDRLVYNHHCLSSLAKYLLEEPSLDGKIGICVRGCESRALQRLIADNKLDRGNLYLVGIPCEGMIAEGQTADKCSHCGHRNPLIYDILVGEPVAERTVDRYAGVNEIEAMDINERQQFWARHFEKCLQCFACRNVCPACNCGECYLDSHRTGWQGKRHNTAENQVYIMTRSFHVADRCVECGECERICPMGIPLMKLNRKLVKEVNDLFGPFEGGVNADEIPALGTFRKDDLEKAMEVK